MTIDVEDVGAFAVLAVLISLPLAWITHAGWTIMTLASDAGATAGQVALMLIGVFVPPLGILHGYMIWFGMGIGS